MGVSMNTEALFNIGYGLYVLSANNETKDNACIINTAMQVTMNPLQLAICINKQNYTTEMIQKNRKFNLSVLTEDADFDLFTPMIFSFRYTSSNSTYIFYKIKSNRCIDKSSSIWM